MTLEVREIGVARAGRPILASASFTANEGEVVAILGPNGAGKTTLLEAIAGLVRATGSVRFRRAELADFRARAGAIAFMPDDATLPEELDVGSLVDARLAAKLGIESLLDASAARLSRGEAKRVWLARTLGRERPVLLLDEPFGAFDPLKLDGVLEVVRAEARRGRTVIASIHQMDVAERVADRIVLLADGRVVAEGTLAALRRDVGEPEASLERIFRALLAGGPGA